MSGLITDRWSGGLASIILSRGPKGNRISTGGTYPKIQDHEVQVRWGNGPWRPCYSGGLQAASVVYAETLEMVEHAAKVRIVNKKGEVVS